MASHVFLIWQAAARTEETARQADERARRVEGERWAIEREAEQVVGE